MVDDRRPIDIIREMASQRESWSDDQILAELKTLPGLPSEHLYLERDWHGPDNPAWDDPEVQRQGCLFIALLALVAERKLKDGVILLLERASYGDLGESMRGIHHDLKAAFDPDWVGLADVCIKAAKFPQPGARMWAIDLLGRLNASKLSEPRGVSVLLEALSDPAKLVRFQAFYGVKWLCDKHPQYKPEVTKALQLLIVDSTETTKHAQDSLRDIEKY